jgi:large subunit ribosomal protein L6
MSRIARKPLKIPTGVTVQKNGDSLLIKGKKGEFTFKIHEAIDVAIDSNLINMSFKSEENEHKSVLGTSVVLLGNMVTGVNVGFEKKLQLLGVGYRAKAQGNKLELSLGYSHPVQYTVPNGITVETPSNTEIVLKGIDKEKIGQVAAEIRRFRPPESYKGKGVRYADEKVILKETKKK